MSKKQKLELTWIGKENRPKLEPRLLLEDPRSRWARATTPGSEQRNHSGPGDHCSEKPR